MTRKSILMLSDDPYVVRACADLDVDLTIACGFGQLDFGLVAYPSGKPPVFVEDSTSVEAVLLGLRRAGLDPSNFDAIYSTDEGGVIPAAVLGRAFGVPSIPIEVAALFRDKSLAKAAIHDAGIDAARYVVIDDLFDVTEDFPIPFDKAVLKPVLGGAAWFTSVIESGADLQAAAGRARDNRQFRTFLLEEFNAGEEWQINGVVFGGELQFISVGGYRKSCLSTLSDHEWMCTHVFDPVTDAHVYGRVTPFTERALQTLGLRDGVFHMEVFYDADTDRLVFGECAARRGGAFTEDEILHKFGVSLAEAAVQCALGVQPVLKPEVRPEIVGTTFLPYTPGTLVHTPSAEELVALPNVEYAMVEWPIGFQINCEPDSTIMKVGQAMLVADSREELYARVDEVLAWFTERSLIVPPHTKTTVREVRDMYAKSPVGEVRPHAAWAMDRS